MSFLFFANVDYLTRAEGYAKSGSRVLWEVLTVLAVVIVLFGVLLFWARYMRRDRPKKRVRGGEIVYREATPVSNGDADGDDEEDAMEVRRKYKRRVRRRDHRARNPTLAETGGLPPSRSESGTEAS